MAIDTALQERLMAAAPYGMGVAVHAEVAPERMAVLSKFGGRTLGELNANANRLARVLRAHGTSRHPRSPTSSTTARRSC